MPATRQLRCRAQVAIGCYDGKDAEQVYGEGGMPEDGLFDGETVICDACYIALGQPSVDVNLGHMAAIEHANAVLAAYKAGTEK